MKSKAFLGLIVVFTMIVIFPSVKGASEIQNLTITSTLDDGFVTEIGIWFFDSDLVTVLDPSMDLRSYLVFNEVKINWWEPLNNATLRLHTANTFGFEADSSVTIYGVKKKNFGGFGSGADVLSAPLTTAFVNFNTSQFYGSQWWDINVSTIVRELLANPYWDGDGSGADPGDNIGFIILGAEGYDSRVFYDLTAGNGFQARLDLGWNLIGSPPGDVPLDAIFVNISQGWEIYTLASWMNFSTFTQVGGDPQESGITDDEFLVTTMYEDDDSYMRRDYDSYRVDSIDRINIKLGLNVTALPWAVANGYVSIWAVGETHEPTQKFDAGFTFDIRTEADRCKFYAWSVDAGALKDSIVWGPEIMEVDLPQTYYIKITLDMNPSWINVSWYDDLEMTNLIWNHYEAFTDGPAWAGGAWLTYEYVNAPTLPAGNKVGWSGYHYSDFGNNDWFVYDPATNTTIEIWDIDGDGDIDQDDANDWISGDVDDPEDTNPGGDWDVTGPFTRFKTRLYIFLMGVGMFWGPLMVFAYRRPTGYAFVIGLFVMLIGVGFLIHAGTV